MLTCHVKITSPCHISAFSEYSHKIGNLTRTCKTDVSVNTYTVPIVTNATPVPPLTVDYNSTVTYTCQDVHSHTARDLTRTCKADAHKQEAHWCALLS